MPTIKFSEEWEKLKPKNFMEGHIFTTARGYTPQKETYYRNSIGTSFDVVLRGKTIGTASLVGVRAERASQGTEAKIKNDTHESWGWKEFSMLMEKFYRNPNPYLIWLKFKVVSIDAIRGLE